ncbi:MAG TPA: hypothetical protein VJO53_01990 [Candidatus Acidoferrales bacterium]|nr:hypothetical protein [Candidatus Acidoferrales bacterium]
MSRANSRANPRLAGIELDHMLRVKRRNGTSCAPSLLAGLKPCPSTVMMFAAPASRCGFALRTPPRGRLLGRDLKMEI